MLTGQKIVHYLFQVENFQSYAVAHPRENPHWSRFIKRTSWCHYQPDGKTVVYLEEGEQSNVKAIYTAIHESCHALNFRKHQHFDWYMQRLRRLMVWSALVVILSVGEAAWQWKLHHVGIILCIFLVISAHHFLQAYKIDEMQAEILTVQLVKRHLQEALTWAGDSRAAEDLLHGIRQETILYHERIHRGAKGMMLFYLILAFGYSAKDLGLAQILLDLVG